jgi:hypothetical protein
MDGITVTIIICAVLFVSIYIGGRYYLREGFDDLSTEEERVKKMAQAHALSVYNSVGVREDIAVDLPYATKPIMSIDDYEYSMVFQNEGNREAGKAEISQAMSRYPLDWSARPPSDELFQNAREAFTNAVAEDAKTAPAEDEYDSISGEAEQPPDKDKEEMDERQLLATYKPEDTKDLLHYSLKDAKAIVRRLYAKKGLVPIIEQSKQGDNVFEIVEVKEKNPKIIWEDELESQVPTAAQRTAMRGESILQVPQVVNDTAAGLDPYFEPRSTVRMDRHDYSKWTPGLERTFAPTYTGNGWA